MPAITSYGLASRNIFMQTKNILSSIEVPQDFSTVLKVVQDPATMIQLNPLVTNFSQNLKKDPSGATFDVTDELDFFFGLIKGSTSYTGVFNNVANGVVTTAKASAGVTLQTNWTLTDQGGKTLITESGAVIAPTILMPFVFGTANDAHDQLLQSLASKLAGGDPVDANTDKIIANADTVASTSSLSALIRRFQLDQLE